MPRLLSLLPFCLAVLLPAPCLAVGVDSLVVVSEDDVRVERKAGGFTVDLLAHAPVRPAMAWEVLTDFAHMADFVPNLKTSQVEVHDDTHIRVRQTGVARYGLFWADFESVRDIRLVPPNEIRAHGIGGNVRRMESVMRLEPETGGTLLRYHAEVQPDFWLPPLLGPSFVRHETAEQFSAIIREMVRRR